MVEICSLDLTKALFRGDLKQLEDLFRDGLSPSWVSPSVEWNLLHKSLVAVNRKPSPKLVEFLIDKGVDVNARDKRGWTPLHFAARLGEASLLLPLLNSGAEVDAETDEGLTPLRVLLGKVPTKRDAIQVLLSRGASVNHLLDGRSVVDYVREISHGDDSDLLTIIAERE